ncbi:hypothetical protein G6L37_29500 [Agrobacterium rubi]|uniref:hypothetical protein n=1 Tax=Agrobacterium rubi TaxID=28099 RepID=UPI0015732487|nr:hypothetical protein [Agrobacterium rubi]NTF09642.1 hypothetical protein [Agrobacterium rubi]NTF22549.1 hypothetical protein [Agrobacterium rubi]NTF29406.1 hypothetical protein [Agrobacterium rubi]
MIHLTCGIGSNGDLPLQMHLKRIFLNQVGMYNEISANPDVFRAYFCGRKSKQGRRPFMDADLFFIIS